MLVAPAAAVVVGRLGAAVVSAAVAAEASVGI